MTIPAGDTTIDTHVGNDVADTFDYNFKISDQGDLKITKTEDATGVDTVLVLTTDYTVTGVGNDNGGNITLVAGALASGYTLTIEDNVALSQLAQFGNQSAFFGQNHEDAIDKLTRLCKRLYSQQSLLLGLPSSAFGASMTLPSGTSRASKFMYFDANGDFAVYQSVGEWRGDWVTSTDYVISDVIRDGSNGNIYISKSVYTSGASVAVDVAAGDLELVIDVAAVSTSEANAATSEANAAASESNAATSESNAATSESNASTSASNAATSEANADTAKTAAEAAQAAAEAAYDNFDDRYLGAKASDPALDNDGNALVTGALYFNTTDNKMKVYNGSAWQVATAAAADVGFTPAGDIAASDVQNAIEELDDEKLAKAAGAMYGLVPSLAADADHDITVSTGFCASSDRSDWLELTAAITKQLDATWAAGDNAGGLFSGTVAADTTYHLFVIKKDSDGSIDAGFDTSLTAANIPAGYTAYKWIGAVVTDASANIIPFKYSNSEFIYLKHLLDLDSTSIGTTKQLATLTIPSGIETLVSLWVHLTNNSATRADVRIFHPDDEDIAATTANSVIGAKDSGHGYNQKATVTVLSDTSSQIAYRSDRSSVDAFRFMTKSWSVNRSEI